MKLETLNIDDYIYINKCKQVTSPFALGSDGNPDTDGIFSQEIFGRVGSNDREIKVGWVDLKRNFIHPTVYNAILQMYRALPEVVSGSRWVKLGVNNEIVTTTDSDPKAETGIDFFYNNWEKIKWNINDSEARAKKEVLFDGIPKEQVFPTKWIIIAAMYRDINLHDKKSGKVNMDEVNSLYIRLINYTLSESITFTSSYLTQANVQSVLVEISDLLTKKPSGKNGLFHSAVMGKTIDYAAVSVISAPRFNSETASEMQIPFNYIGVPLATICAIFYPMIVKALEDIFHDVVHSTEVSLNGKLIYVDDNVRSTLDSNSLKDIVASYVNDKTKSIRTQRFTLNGLGEGRFASFEAKHKRPFTVTDLLYRAACDVVYNRSVLCTRFPITDAGSTIINKVKILTTERTIDISQGAPKGTFDFEFMRTYPNFQLTDKGQIDSQNTLWIDTLVPNNAYLASMGGDYDGGNLRPRF